MAQAETVTVSQLWDAAGSNKFFADPDRLSQMFDRLSPQFGAGFSQRATEAIRCHAFGVYIACCAMCGAATESILLAVAIAKNRNEGATLAGYRAANGRRRVIESVVGGQDRQLPTLSEVPRVFSPIGATRQRTGSHRRFPRSRRMRLSPDSCALPSSLPIIGMS
jgi:hypothetical protein